MVFVIFSLSVFSVFISGNDWENLICEQNFLLSLFLAGKRSFVLSGHLQSCWGGLQQLQGRHYCYTSHWRRCTHFYMKLRHFLPIKARFPCLRVSWAGRDPRGSPKSDSFTVELSHWHSWWLCQGCRVHLRWSQELCQEMQHPILFFLPQRWWIQNWNQSRMGVEVPIACGVRSLCFEAFICCPSLTEKSL